MEVYYALTSFALWSNHENPANTPALLPVGPGRASF